MEVVRKIIDSKLLMPFMELPKEMTGNKVEIIVLPVSQTEKNKHTTTVNMKGFLKDYANPLLIETEKKAWELNVKEKYGNI